MYLRNKPQAQNHTDTRHIVFVAVDVGASGDGVGAHQIQNPIEPPFESISNEMEEVYPSWSNEAGLLWHPHGCAVISYPYKIPSSMDTRDKP
jgi:hypothetical protein